MTGESESIGTVRHARLRRHPVRRKTRKQVLSEFRCAEILDAARAVFATKGFSRATVDDIAEAAAIAKGTVYLYFPSKDAIYLAALRKGVEEVLEETTRRLEGAQGTLEKLRIFVETRIRYFDENRDFFKIYHSEFGNVFSRPASISREFKQLYDRHLVILRTILSEGERSGELRPMKPQTAAAIYDVTRGLIVQRLLGWSKTRAEDDVRFVLDLIWRGIGRR